MPIHVKTFNGMTTTIFCHPADSILTQNSTVKDKEGAPEYLQRLIFAGKQLNGGCLHDYNIRNDSSLHLVLRLPNGLYVG